MGARTPEHFTGTVWFGDMASDVSEAGMKVLGVQFAPGSRTDWHSHPAGQVLHVVSGSGLVANKAGERVEISAGDTVNTPPNVGAPGFASGTSRPTAGRLRNRTTAADGRVCG
jgi:quercetin dioxygenase-like cupin family protein